MKELTLNFEYCDWIGIDLIEYLLSIEGIINASINTEESYVYVKYDSSKINYKVIKYEILFCINALRVPSIVAFDKHEKPQTNYTLLIKDICCEYCFKGLIDDLFMTPGTISAKSDFDYNNMFNIKIDITYDKEILTKKDILEIEGKFNNM